MYQNTRRVDPLNWPFLVEESLRRRKAEKITQREHAALANVSVPTMAAFERKETTLSLTKVFDILRVVGLLDEPTENSLQDTFVKESFSRWNTLRHSLPPNSKGRFPHGCFRFDYFLEGELKTFSIQEIKDSLKQITQQYPRRTFPFWVPTNNPAILPQEYHNILECWLGAEQSGFPLKTADESEYWRVSLEGRLFLLRGYWEDSQHFPPGTIFDITLPLERMAEVMLHASSLASLMGKDKEIQVHFRVSYSGLKGRVLSLRANHIYKTYASRTDEAVLETIFPAENVKERLLEHITPLAISLFERFGLIRPDFIKEEIERFQEELNPLKI